MPIIQIDVPSANAARVFRPAELVAAMHESSDGVHANLGDLIVGIIQNQVNMHPNESFAMTVALQQSMDTEQPDNRNTLTKQQCADRYPAMRFSKKVCEKTCGICLQEYRANRRIVRLPCGHVFCRDCLYRWLTKESCTCPVCRECL